MRKETIYTGNIINFGIETVTLPDQHTMSLEIARHPGGAGTLAYNDQHQVCLIYQYRHAAGGWIWEIPAGKIDPQEPPADTAKRELMEETGIKAEHWQPLGTMLSTPGFCDEVIYLFLAKQLTLFSSKTEIGELLEVHWIDFEQALTWAYQDKIRDAKTLAALFRSQPIITSN